MTPSGLELLCDSVPVKDWRIATSCGIHPTAFSLYKTGKRRIPKRAVESLACYFSVTPAQITGEEPMEFASLVKVTEIDDPTRWVEQSRWFRRCLWCGARWGHWSGCHER